MITESGQEFIDRETQLPADPRMVAPGVPPGTLDNVPLGNPAIDYDVRSTYDVRPVNGADFEQSGVADPVMGEGFVTWSVVGFTVPLGYVAVVREWNFIARGASGVGFIDVAASLQRNGVDFPYNNDVAFSAGGERKPTFMIVDEGQTIGARASASSGGQATMVAYGNLLTKTGRAYPYEIANPVGVMRQTTLAPEPLQPPPPPPPPKEVIREVVREAPPTTVQQPAAPPPPVSTDPPWPVTWVKQTTKTDGSCYAGNAMYWTPMRPINGVQSRLTAAEVAQWRDWLQAHCPAPERGRYTISNR